MLDECDEMLNMGFVEDVEKILTAGGDIKTQTLLFSATLPVWVKDITRRFLEPTHKLVDLVGTDKMKVRSFFSLQMLCLAAGWRCECIADLTVSWSPYSKRDNACLTWRRHNSTLVPTLRHAQERGTSLSASACSGIPM